MLSGLRPPEDRGGGLGSGVDFLLNTGKFLPGTFFSSQAIFWKIFENLEISTQELNNSLVDLVFATDLGTNDQKWLLQLSHVCVSKTDTVRV